MTVYGDIPGVRVEVTSAGVSGVTIGQESYLVLIGTGDPDVDEVEPNEPIRIESREDAEEDFGEDSDIAAAHDRALANGANPNYIFGVKAETELIPEDEVAGPSGVLEQEPLPNKSTLSFTENGVDGEELDVVFSYEEDVPVPEDEGVVHVNPITGEWEAETSVDTVDIEYETATWDDAVQSAEGAIGEAEFGIFAPLTSSQDALDALESILAEIRGIEYKMALGMIAAEPNMTVGEERAGIDTQTIEARVSNDTIWSVAGTSLEDSSPNDPGYGYGALGAVAGKFAGNANTDPVYDDTLSGISGLAQKFSNADLIDLRGEYLVPLRDTGTIRVADNHSTYDQATDGGWERDFFRRRIVDLVTVTSFRVSRQQMGGVLDGDMIEDVKDALVNQMDDLVDDGLLEEGGQSVSAYRSDDRTIGVDLEIRPFGVAKAADVELKVFA